MEIIIYNEDGRDMNMDEENGMCQDDFCKDMVWAAIFAAYVLVIYFWD